MRGWLTILVVALLSILPSPALAQDDATRAAVRDLGYAGVALYKAEQYDEAFDKLDRAYRVLRVPTLGLWSARALEKLGRLVESSERYFEVTRLPLPERERDVHRAAQDDARNERAALVPRIPSIRVVLAGDNTDASVTVDEQPIRVELLDAPIPVDPGVHTVRVTRDGDVLGERRTHVEERGAVELSFSLPVRVVPEPDPVGPNPVQPERVVRDEAFAQRTIGWAAIGFGGVATSLGAVLGIVAATKSAELDCPDTGCHPDVVDDVALVNQLRTPSAGWLIAGVAAAVVGTALVVFAPGDEIEVGVGAGSAKFTVRW